MLTQNFMTKYYNKAMNYFKLFNSRNISKMFLGILPIFLLAITFSCEEDPSSLGSDIIPDSDQLAYYYDTSISFSGEVFTKKPIPTTNLTQYPIGIIDDEYFGLLTTSFAGQFYPEKLEGNLDVLSMDVSSATLYIAIDTIFGPITNSVAFNAYELKDSIRSDSTYNSEVNINELFSSENLISTSSIIMGDSILAINFTEEFTKKFTSSGDDINESTENFRKIFEGISIVPGNYSNEGKILITNFSSSDTKITLEYNDSLEKSYNFLNGNKIGKFNYNYETGVVNNYLNNQELEEDTLLFYQGLSGVNSKIFFSDFSDIFHQDTTYSILKAEITIPVFKDENFNNYPHPNNLYLYYTYSDSTLSPVQDYYDYQLNYGPFEDSEFKFNITRHFKKMIEGEVEDTCLNFAVGQNIIYPNRIIFNAGKNIKLRITYTKH